MEQEQEILVRAYKTTFEQGPGKMVLEDLLKKSSQTRIVLPETDSGIDVNRMVYIEGQRSVLVYILNKIATNLNLKQDEEAVHSIKENENV